MEMHSLENASELSIEKHIQSVRGFKTLERFVLYR